MVEAAVAVVVVVLAVAVVVVVGRVIYDTLETVAVLGALIGVEIEAVLEA